MVVTCVKYVNSLFLAMAKSYGQKQCPIAAALDVIGERWTILLLRDFFLHGPRRFQDFQASFDGLAPNTLSTRLKDMEARGLVERRVYSEHPPRLEYFLTEKGKSLGPVLKALRNWGLQHR
jgi:DNA-binding HxlR family transcriptional regulator